ncbi:MAG: PCMD domain-containing protein [Bacteroidales bacterium]|nr:PCMD domain-containing protein [Bacteroidales bacterium]
MNHILKYCLISSLMLGAAFNSFGQSLDIKYCDMDNWVRREIKESAIIGGNDKVLYEIGKPDTIKGAIPRVIGDSQWETSSVYAKVAGIHKVSSTVFPEKRGNGYCARLETRLEEVVVFGIVNLKVLATGTIFTGSISEPVRDSKNPMQKLMQGIPCNERIKGIKFDYKAKTGGKRIKSTGFSKADLPGKNEAEVAVILQKRWEDAEGNIFAKRVGTAWMRIPNSVDNWINGFELSVHYGDITKTDYYKDYMKLYNNDHVICGKNKAGENKQIIETGWGSNTDEPTHIIIRCSAGYGGAYVGAIGDMLWIDNIEIIRE